MAGIREKILGKYGIDIDQENIFKYYKIDNSEISQPELEKKIDETRKRWTQSVNGTNEKNAARDRARLEKADKYEAILRDVKLRKEVFDYYSKGGEKKGRGSGPVGGTGFAKEYFELLGTSKKIRKADVEFFFEYFKAEGKNKKAILEMLEKELKIKLLGKEDKHDEEDPDEDPAGKKKDKSSPLIVNQFQKATVLKLRKCLECYYQVQQNGEVCRTYPDLLSNLYSFLGLNGVETSQQFADLISDRGKEAYKVQQDKADQGKGPEYRPLVDLYNTLQELAGYRDVVDNLAAFKLLIQYPKLTPYMFAVSEVKPNTLDGIFDIARREYAFRDMDDFILNYYNPVHDHFNIINNGIHSIIKKAEKKTKSNKVLNKIDEKLGRKKDRKINLGMELIHWLVYWPVFIVYLVFEIFKGIFTQLHKFLIPVFVALFVGANWWFPKKFGIDNLLVLRKIFFKAEWFEYIGADIGDGFEASLLSLIAIIALLAIYVLPPLFAVRFLNVALKDLNKRYDWIGYQRTFQSILHSLRQRTEAQYAAQKELFFKKKVPWAITNIVCLTVLVLIIYLTPVGLKALSEKTGYFQPQATSNQNVQHFDEQSSNDPTDEEMETGTEMEPEEDYGEVIIVITIDSANIRSGPSTSHEILTVASREDIFIATGNQETASNGGIWYEIYLNDEHSDTGWVNASIVERREDLPANKLVGVWHGEQGSELTLGENGICYYKDGISGEGEGTWEVDGQAYLRVHIGTFDYEIYAVLDDGFDTATMILEADSSNWLDEVFSKE